MQPKLSKKKKKGKFQYSPTLKNIFLLLPVKEEHINPCDPNKQRC